MPLNNRQYAILKAIRDLEPVHGTGAVPFQAVIAASGLTIDEDGVEATVAELRAMYYLQGSQVHVITKAGEARLVRYAVSAAGKTAITDYQTAQAAALTAQANPQQITGNIVANPTPTPPLKKFGKGCLVAIIAPIIVGIVLLWVGYRYFNKDNSPATQPTKNATP